MTYPVIPRPTVEQAHADITAHFARPDAVFGRMSERGTQCAYRRGQDATSPIRCGVGILIPDEAYDPVMDTVDAANIGALLSMTRETDFIEDDLDDDGTRGSGRTDIERGDLLFPEFREWGKHEGFEAFLSDVQGLHDDNAMSATRTIGERVPEDVAMANFRDGLAAMDLTKYQQAS